MEESRAGLKRLVLQLAFCNSNAKLDVNTAALAQFGRAPDCGSGSRGFESLMPPQDQKPPCSFPAAISPLPPNNELTGLRKTHFGPESAMGGLISSRWGTLVGKPSDYGTHWQGFGKRYGMRLTGVSVSKRDGGQYRRDLGRASTLRAISIGAVQGPPGPRHQGDFPGDESTGSNFISNTWRPDSEASVGNAAFRTLLGFVGRSSNAFQEFWPDVRHRFSGQELNAKVLPTTKNLPISASEPDH